ncbi:MAG: hypothetical protein QXT64_07080 [Desulfurococcaceae archaeon]
MNRFTPVLYLVAALTALAVILRFFELPYPPAPFLKYDASGVPLAVIAFMNLRAAYSVLPIYFTIPVALGTNSIGMAMKCLAELSTFTPLALTFRKLHGKRSDATMIAVAVATVSRVAIMSLANYLVTPHWLLFVKYPGIESFEQAYEFTVSFVLPHSVIFNLTIALIVSPLSIRVYRVLTRTGILR